MKLSERLNAIHRLEEQLQSMQPDEKAELFQRAQAKNPWFTRDQINLAWKGILKLLAPGALKQWAARYSPEPKLPKKVGIVMAGNIPLVGFHDFLCILASGHHAIAKRSSQDEVLITHIAQMLKEIEPRFDGLISFEDRLNGVDAVIATGSDNTGRYFEYYFRNVPHIIRKNRSSCAVIMGEEQPSEFETLGLDVFSYFGLGCRNVSKLFVPDGFDVTKVLKAWEGFSSIAHHHKYANNYDYNKSIYLVNLIPFLDTGFVMLKESTDLVSPISVVYYERYSTQENLREKINAHREKIQCIVAAKGWYPNSVPFGKAQQPELTDYADNIDTMAFLAKLS